MRKVLLQSFALLFAAWTSLAQAPQKFNYQGVARNAAGAPLASATLGLRFTIHDGSAAGATVYQETQTAATNSFGLYNVAIGTGTVVSGTFASVNWSGGDKYIQVEIDPAGGTSYVSMGTDQLLSVPYAMYAAGSSMPNVGTAGTYGSATQVPVITTDAQGRITGVTNTTITANISGTGTANNLAKFTGAGAIGNSLLFDNGSQVALGTTTPSTMCKVQISGAGTYGTLPYYQAGLVVDGASSSANVSAVYGEGGWRGVFGRNPGTAGGSEAIGVQGMCEGSAYTSGGYGVKGNAIGTGPKNYGVYGLANGATVNNYGVYGSATGTGAFAGYFQGNVSITGSIAKGSGTFKIDHPLDPENKYLYHSFVESPDMMNIYNGNVVTDAGGNATVTLPDYFEALNKEFRYQLTVVGTFAQAIVAQKVNGNKFSIKTDKPNVEVSWQVTGVRHDKYADAHRVVPEVQKEAQFKGHYLHASEWGQPYDKSFDAITAPKETKGNNVAEK